MVLLGCFLLIYFYMIPKFFSNTEQYVIDRLDYISVYMGDVFTNLKNTALNIAIDRTLEKNLLSADAVENRSGFAQLNSKEVENDIIGQVFLWYDGTESMYTSIGTVPAAILERTDYSVEFQQLMAQLRNTKGNRELYTHLPEGFAIGYHIAGAGRLGQDVSVVFVVDDAYLKKLIQLFLMNKDDGIAALLADGTVLFQSNGYGAAMEHPVTFSAAAPDNEFRYVYLMPRKSIWGENIGVILTVTVVLLLIMLLGLVLVVWYSQLSHRPIMKFYQLAGRQTEQEDDAELNHLYDTIATVFDDSQRMRSELEFQKGFLHRQVMLTLLSKHGYNEEGLRNICKNAGLVLDGAFFLVLLIAGLDAAGDSNLIDAAVHMAEEHHAGYATEEIETGDLVVILNIRADETGKQAVDRFASLMQLLCTNGETLSMYAGEPVQLLTEIRTSYLQAHHLKQQSESKHASTGENLIADKLDEKKLYFEAIDFIAKNFKDSSLSIGLVADHLGKSTYYVSRLIKSNLNISYIDYVSSLRLSYAKKLLVETDMTVERIVREIGYLNVPSFHKKFKKNVGVAPLEYRKMAVQK